MMEKKYADVRHENITWFDPHRNMLTNKTIIDMRRVKHIKKINVMDTSALCNIINCQSIYPRHKRYNQ